MKTEKLPCIFLLLCLYSFPFCWGQQQVNIYLPADYSRQIIAELKKVHDDIAGKLKKILGFALTQPVSIVICSNRRELIQLSEQQLPSWLLGLAIPDKNTIGIDGSKLGAVYNNLRAVVKHEMCHLYLGAWERTHRKRLPLWFNEGICEWISGAFHGSYQQDLLINVVGDNLLPLARLESQFPDDPTQARLAYLQVRHIIEYIIGRYGPQVVPQILQNYAQSIYFSTAIRESLGIRLDTLEQEWRQSLTPENPWLWRIINMFSLFTLLAIGVLVAYWLQRQRAKKIMARWQQEEQLEDLYY